MKLLLIEDEVKTAQTLKKGLEENNYDVTLAFDGEMGLLLAKRNAYDLIITDIIIPGINGLEFCRQLREHDNNTPIIMLTALSMTSDKISGFNAGTDDYMVKPFEFEELLVRIKSLIKRSKNVIQIDRKLVFEDLSLNLDTKEVIRNEKIINLTAKEFALLEFFIRNKGKVLSRMNIAEHVWDINFDTGTNMIEVYVNYLRNKIDKDFPVKLIHTKVGMGYIMRTE